MDFFESSKFCLLYKSDGTFAVLKNFFTISKSKDACVDFEKKIQERYGVGVGSDIGNHLHCSLCGQVFNKPVLTACCGETFCEPCILSRLNSSSRSKICPSCYEEINPSDLFFNKVIQDSVNAIRGILSVPAERSQGKNVES
jgi:protein MPE1